MPPKTCTYPWCSKETTVLACKTHWYWLPAELRDAILAARNRAVVNWADLVRRASQWWASQARLNG